MKILVALAAIAACALTVPAALAQHGYLAAQFGRAEAKEPSGTDGEYTLELSSLADDDEVFGVTGGYNFSKHWGMELGYRNLGTYPLRIRSLGSGADMEVKGWTLGAAGHLPVSSRFTLYGKLGLLAYDASVDHGFVLGRRVEINASDDGTELYYGIGGKVRLGKGTVDLGLDYVIYNDIANAINLVLTFNIAKPSPASP